MSLNDAMGDRPAVHHLQYRVVLFAIFIGAIVSTTTAQAQTTYVWNDTTTSWTTTTAWTPNGPANWSTGQNYVSALASFPSQATINNQPNIDNDVVVGGISIDDSQATWNISSSSRFLNLGASGLTVTGAGTNTKTGTGTTTTTVSAKVFLPYSQTWTIGQGITVAVTNNISGTGNLTKAGPGTLLLSGTATNTGTITATGGTLVLQGDRSAATGTVVANGGAVRFADGTKLGGSIDIANDTGFQGSQGGTDAAPTNSPHIFGDSPEEFTVMGNMTMEEGAEVEFDVEGSEPETGYDRMDVDGNVSLGGATLDFLAGKFSPNIGDAFFIINNKGDNPIDGQFANAPEGSIITSNGLSFRITYFADTDIGSLTGGNDVALIAVPEPAAHFLALSAAVLMAWRYLRRKSRHISVRSYPA